MPTIPTPEYHPDGAGFTGVKISDDTVASTHRDERGADTAIVKTIDSGNAVYLQLANVRGLTFSRPMLRNASGDPIVLDPTGSFELNGPSVGAS